MGKAIDPALLAQLLAPKPSKAKAKSTKQPVKVPDNWISVVFTGGPLDTEVRKIPPYFSTYRIIKHGVELSRGESLHELFTNKTVLYQDTGEVDSNGNRVYRP